MAMTSRRWREILFSHRLDLKHMAEQQTALHLAARKAHKEVVKLLLDKGADPNAQTSTGVTPLYDVPAGAEINTPSW